MASIGTSGRYPNKCNGDLLKLYRCDELTEAPTEILPLPMKDISGDNDGIKFVNTEVSFPHDVFYHYSQNDSSSFASTFGSKAAIQDFWAQQSLDDPKLYRHPLLTIPGYQELCIVGKIHSDAVAITDKYSLHTISCYSFLATGDPLDIMLYFGSAVKQWCCTWQEHGVSTMHTLFRMFVWSLTACLYNRHPVLDWNNQPWKDQPNFEVRQRLANQKLHNGNLFFAIIGLSADLEELCQEYLLAHYNSLKPCFWCPCDLDLLPWTNYGDEDSCFALAYEPPNDGSMVPAPSCHPVFDLLTLWGVLWDVMHGLDLGPSQHEAGNILFDFVHDTRLGPNKDAALKEAWVLIDQGYKDLHITNRLDNLTLASNVFFS